MTRTLQGALLALTATLFFTMAAALVKEASITAPILMIVFFRQLGVFLSTAPLLIRNPSAMRTKRPGLHALRVTGAFVGISAGFWAVSVLPLTLVTVLEFSRVFFVVLIGAFILGEGVGPRRLTAVAIGFVGVVIAIRPGSEGLNDPHVFIPLVGAMGAAVALSCVRVLSQTERSETLLLYQSLAVGLPAALALPFVWTPQSAEGWVLIALIALVSAIGQWIGVASIRRAEITIISGLEYVRLIYAALLGYLFFAETPDGATWIGAGLIIVSGVIILWRERKSA